MSRKPSWIHVDVCRARLTNDYRLKTEPLDFVMNLAWLEDDLVVTVAMMALVVITVLLIANLVGAINVIG